MASQGPGSANLLLRRGWTQAGGPLSVFTSLDGRQYEAWVIMLTDYGDETNPLVSFKYVESSDR